MTEPEMCPKCGAAIEACRYCISCGADRGYPNVRAANSVAETTALTHRCDDARLQADTRRTQAEFDRLSVTLQTDSHVVVAMPPIQARLLVGDPRTLYSNYEELVGSSGRTPAAPPNDTDRHAVSGRLFGAYAKEIRYGVLSLDGRGLPNYGLVFFRLRNVAIAERVTFLHDNSYTFVKDVPPRDPLPQGYRSDWKNRHKLALAKLGPDLATGSGPREWAQQLLVAGATREDDRFIEAHIFGPFNVDSVESVSIATNGVTRQDRIDIMCVQEELAKRGPKATKS